MSAVSVVVKRLSTRRSSHTHPCSRPNPRYVGYVDRDAPFVVAGSRDVATLTARVSYERSTTFGPDIGRSMLMRGQTDVIRTLRRIGLGAVLALTLPAAACGGNANPSGATTAPQLTGWVSIDGSSTVAPLSLTAADSFMKGQPAVNVTVGTSGTGGGFDRFCKGETDISDASRKIENVGETDECMAAGINPTELNVANDGISIVVNPLNTWVDCLTTAQLKEIWDKGSTVTNWNQVDPRFPDEPLGSNQLFGPGADSGTFDFFTARINGREKQSRSNYTASEDDNVLVQGVAGSKGALGYLGYAYYEENLHRLKLVKVDSGAGCTEPSVASIQDGSYSPLSRPLFIYVSDKSASKPQVNSFVEFYVRNIDEIVKEAKFVPLTATQKTALVDAFARFESGS
jgi:phosphate transport system substrate-binding protein